MSTLEVKELSHPAGEVIKIASGKTLDLKSQGTTTLPTGSVIQVKQGVLTSTMSTTSQSLVDSGLTVTITPSSASSKILISSILNVFWQNAQAKVGISVTRDDTVIFVGDGVGARQRVSALVYFALDSNAPLAVPINYLDSPNTTSAVTYKIKLMRMDPQGTVGVNRDFSDSNTSIQAYTASNIIVQEIQG